MVLSSLKKIIKKDKENEEEYYINDKNEDYLNDINYQDIQELLSDDENKNVNEDITPDTDSFFSTDELITPFSDLFSIKSDISTEPQYENKDLVYEKTQESEKTDEYLKLIDMLLDCYDY